MRLKLTPFLFLINLLIITVACEKEPNYNFLEKPVENAPGDTLRFNKLQDLIDSTGNFRDAFDFYSSFQWTKTRDLILNFNPATGEIYERKELPVNTIWSFGFGMIFESSDTSNHYYHYEIEPNGHLVIVGKKYFFHSLKLFPDQSYSFELNHQQQVSDSLMKTRSISLRSE